MITVDMRRHLDNFTSHNKTKHKEYLMKYSSMRSPTTNILEFQLKFTPAPPAATTTPAAPTATTGADTTSHTPSRTTKGSYGPYNK